MATGESILPVSRERANAKLSDLQAAGLVNVLACLTLAGFLQNGHLLVKGLTLHRPVLLPVYQAALTQAVGFQHPPGVPAGVFVDPVGRKRINEVT